jgi:hypothetical protein
MNEDLSLTFIATYYKLLYNTPDVIHQFYDPNARISRPSGSFILSDPPSPSSLFPFDPKTTIVKIFDSHFVSLEIPHSASVITVFGSVSDSPFTHRFNLILQSSRWFIIEDSFFSFDQVAEDTVGAESGTIDHFAASLPPPLRLRSSPLADFDPTHTITIVNLSNNYNGTEIATHFSQFGTITNQHFTHKTIYIEFESPEMAAEAANAPPLLHQGITIIIKQGMEVNEQKSPGRSQRPKADLKS